jgi:hypothetical protein
LIKGETEVVGPFLQLCLGGTLQSATRVAKGGAKGGCLRVLFGCRVLEVVLEVALAYVFETVHIYVQIVYTPNALGRMPSESFCGRKW